MRWGFVGQRPSDVLALGRDFTPTLIATCEGGESNTKQASLLGANEFVSCESLEPRRRNWATSTLSSAASLVHVGHRLDRVCSYANTPAMAKALPPSMPLHGSDDTHVAVLARKDVARAIFNACGIPSVRCQLLPRAATDVREAVSALAGDTLIVQTLRGSSGSSTWLASSRAEIAHLAQRLDARLLVSEYVAGPVLNVHVQVGRSVSVSQASVQIVGLSPLTEKPFGYSGADFGAVLDVDPGSVVEARQAAHRVGVFLQSRGWTGPFGFDWIASESGPLALEINPRLQASSWLLTELQTHAGSAPTLTIHQSKAHDFTNLPREDENAFSAGGFLVLRHRSTDQLPTTRLNSGRWSIQGSEMHYLGPGVGLLDCATTEVHVEGAPDLGVELEQEAVLVRVATWQRVFDPVSASLTAFGETLATCLRRQLRQP